VRFVIDLLARLESSNRKTDFFFLRLLQGHIIMLSSLLTNDQSVSNNIYYSYMHIYIIIYSRICHIKITNK
jgi:hypothetical protein